MDLDDELAGLERVLREDVDLGAHEEVRGRERAASARGERLDAGVQGDERDAGRRRVDDRACVVPEDRVELVLARLREALGPALLEALELGRAEVPAARPLAEIAREGRRVADLRRRGSEARVGEGGQLGSQALGHCREGHESTNGNAAGRVSLNGRVGGQSPQIDDEVGGEVVFLDSIEKFGPGPLHFGRNLLLSRRGHLSRGIFPASWLDPFEAPHALTSRFGTFPSASRILAGVIGRAVGRMPVAWAIALATAAAVGTVAGSPMPRAWALFLPG